MKKAITTLTLLFWGIFSTNAQTLLDLEGIPTYLAGQSCTALYNQDVTGSYDGDRGTWIGQINRSFLPTLVETEYVNNPEEGSPLYGILVLVPDANNSLYHLHDLGLFFPYSSGEDGWLYYDGTGIFQYLQDPILDLGEDEEIPDDYIYGAYLQCGVYELALSSAPPTIRLAIYSLNNLDE